MGQNPIGCRHCHWAMVAANRNLPHGWPYTPSFLLVPPTSPTTPFGTKTLLLTPPTSPTTPFGAKTLLLTPHTSPTIPFGAKTFWH